MIWIGVLYALSFVLFTSSNQTIAVSSQVTSLRVELTLAFGIQTKTPFLEYQTQAIFLNVTRFLREGLGVRL
jgi:hypothetical protein